MLSARTSVPASRNSRGLLLVVPGEVSMVTKFPSLRVSGKMASCTGAGLPWFDKVSNRKDDAKNNA